MAKRSPKMITGARAQENYPDRDLSGPGQAPEPEFRMPSRIPTKEEIDAVHAEDERRLQKSASSGEKRIYQSKYGLYRLQVKVQKDMLVDGRVIKGDNLAIQFQDGLYQTADPKLVEFLDTHPSFGIDFWDLEALKTEAAVKEYEHFVKRVQETPELLARLRQDLSKDDFDVVKALSGGKNPPPPPSPPSPPTN